MLVFFSVGFLVCHALALLLFPAQAQVVSFAFLIVAPLLATGACVRRAVHAGDGWVAVGVGLVLWAGGMAASMHETVFAANPGELAGLSMLLYVLYGVPLTFALASPDDEVWHLRAVDACLALALGYLFFVHTDTFVIVDRDSEQGMAQLRLMFDVENIFIALFALVRYVASVDAQRRSFFGTLLVFACVYLAAAAYINHFEHDSEFGVLADVVIGVPFLLLAVLAQRPVGAEPAPQSSARLMHLVRAGSPLMLPVSVLVVSGFLVSTHLWLAVAGFVVAFVGYGLRSVLAQVRWFEKHQALDALARLDPLTGLANRRQFDEAMQREWARARRSRHGMALLLADIDHFKRLNDVFGHQAGDAHLRTVARALADGVTRPGDLVARYGGEEFIALLPACNIDGARQVAERMRACVEALRLPGPDENAVVTVSVGVAAVEVAVADAPFALIDAADAALYEAKNGGRNRVAWRMLGSPAA